MTDPTIVTLRKAFSDRPQAPQDSCPEPQRLWDAAQAELTPEQLAPLVDHLATCGDCAEAWSIARQLSPREEEADVVSFEPAKAPTPAATTQEAPAPRGRLFKGPWLMVALAAVAAIAVTPTAMQLISGEEAAYRDHTQVVSSALDADHVPRTDAVLRWTGPEDAVYALRVTDEALSPILSASALQTLEYRIPEDALATIPDGSTILWHVEATLADGQVIGSSTYTTRVRGSR